MQTRRAVIAGLLGSLLVVSVTPAKHRRRKHKRRKHEPSPYKAVPAWPIASAPRVIPVLYCAGADWIGPVRAAVETWNGVQQWLRLELQETAVGSEGALPDPGTILILSAQRDAWWGGLTEIAPSDEGINGARITFDEADYAGRYAWPKSTERERVAAHELGHAMGLSHTPAHDDGCMAPGPGRHPQTHPSAWTLRQLALTYGDAAH